MIHLCFVFGFISAQGIKFCEYSLNFWIGLRIGLMMLIIIDDENGLISDSNHPDKVILVSIVH